MAARLTFEMAQRALAEHTEEIQRQIPVEACQLSLPVDGSGVRIRASVNARDRAKVPSSVTVKIGGRSVRIPLDVTSDYRPTRARTSPPRRRSRSSSNDT